MKTLSSRSQFQEDRVTGIIDSLIFGYLQRKQYTKTLHTLLSESPHLTKDVTTVSNAPNQIILNVNCFLHDKNLEQIIETFHNYGRFDVTPTLLELGKRLRELTNEFSSELAYGCHSYSSNEQSLYGRKMRMRSQHQNLRTMPTDQGTFSSQMNLNKPSVYCAEQVPPLLEPTHVDPTELQYAQSMESVETSAMDISSSESNTHHSRRKATQPLKHSKRVAEQLAFFSNEKIHEKDNSFNGIPFDSMLGIDNMEDILKNMVDDETLYQTLENAEREEAMEAEHTSRDSTGAPPVDLSLDIPMHDEIPPPSLVSPLTRTSSFHPPSSVFMPPTQPTAPTQMVRSSSHPLHHHPTPFMAINTQQESRDHRESRIENAPPLPPPQSLPSTSFPPPPPPPSSGPPPLMSLVQPHLRMMGPVIPEPERKHSSVNDVAESSTRNGSMSSQTKSRMGGSSPIHALPLPPPPAVSASPVTQPKLSTLGRIPKKGQPSSQSQTQPLDSSPSLHSKTLNNPLPATASPKAVEPIRISRGKIAPTMNEGRRDSIDSQDAMRAESMGESDCGMTESEDNESVFKTERDRSRDTNKSQRKASWDDLFDDSPSTLEESNKEKKRREAQEREKKRRLEMREMEKKKEREKRRKKDDEKKPERREERDRNDKRDERRRDSRGDEKDEREREKEREERMKEKEKEEKQKKIEMKRKEQEEQRKIIEAARKREKEAEERARQKKKEEEDRKRELREREEEKRREKEREEEKRRGEKEKKEEEEKMRKERENKAKEERRNELERRRRKELQMKKQNEKPPISLGDSPLDKIAAEMDGKEIRKENEYETATPASSRVMEISSGMERRRSTALMGSLHSSKTGIYLDKVQRLRGESTEKEKGGGGAPPDSLRQPRRPVRIQMAPVKRPPPPVVTSDEEETEGEGEDGDGGTTRNPSHKKGRLEDKRIDNVLNKLYR